MKINLNYDSPFQVIKAEIYESGLISYSPNCMFIRAGCHMPYTFYPCVENDETRIQIENNGDSGECAVVIGFKGTNYWLWTGVLNTGQGILLTVLTHYQPEEFPQSEIVSVKFFTGYPIDENNMAVTDTIEYNIFIHVRKIDFVELAIIGGIAIGGVGIAYSLMKARRPIRGRN